jgi:transposase
MYFKFSGRTNPKTKSYDSYYRLVESYRNSTGRVCHRTILNVGFIADQLTPEQLNSISRTLTDIYQHKESLFKCSDPIVNHWVSKLWSQIVAEQRLDLTRYDSTSRMVAMDTIEHKNVREIGTEWMCYNTWQKLGIDQVLEENEFSELEIQLAQSQIISRAVYPGSELATARWIKENSAICELTGFPLESMNKDRLYRGALKLYEIKDKLEQHLSIRTNELFDIQDKIVLYDLTNTYFEGTKRNSKLAKFGRSKEKRSDAKLVVLALVVNIYGFIKYSSIHEGNFSDTTSLEAILNELNYTVKADKPLIVMDAGVATQANLKLVREKNYHYLCVSRIKLRNYELDPSRLTVLLETKSKNEVVLKKVLTDKESDYYLEVISASKGLKEAGMKNRFEQGFEEAMENIKNAIHKKGGTKRVEKVHERIGRAKQKYPSVHNRYLITVTNDKWNKNVETLRWQKDPSKEQTTTEGLGKYFIRTSLDMKDEVLVWNVYNTIREIESTFRTLKTDLDLRPIYHKNDDSTLAHLHLGLLAYWLVNTIRCQLKRQGIKSNWQEIVRIGNTQKIITTSGYNKAGVEVKVRKCSQAESKLSKLYHALGIKARPFTKLKSVVHKVKFENSKNQQIGVFSSA